MIAKLRSLGSRLFAVDKDERLKVAFLWIIFFLVIGGYTIAKEFKDSIFMTVVGRGYVPYAKVLSMFILIPPIFLYARLVDTMRRYQVLMICSTFFGVSGLIFSYFVGHPTIGIGNTNADWNRTFGWLFYFFSEAISPFLVSVFWAFANSTTSPEAARKNYGIIVSGSKVGGVLSAGLAWLLFNWSASAGLNGQYDVLVHQVVLAIASLLILIVPFVVLGLMKNVPGKLLHGYEAAYQVEKQRAQTEKPKTSMLAGLGMFVRYPYVLGIFGIVFFYESIMTVLSFIRLGEAGASSTTVSGVSGYLLKTSFYIHSSALLISLFFTRALFEWLGERRCLLLVPVVTSLILIYFMFNMTPSSLIVVYVAFKAINYAFFWPVRESLYIPTVKEIKFKSKSWIDVFGTKFAKSTGSAFNAVFASQALVPSASVLSLFFGPVMGLWLITAYFLGKRFDRAVANNEVIGHEEEIEAASDSKG